MLDELRQDLRYGLRALRSAPAFTVTALLTLALGIGANAAIFSAVRAVLLEPLPFADPGRIVRAYHSNPANGVLRGVVSEPDYLDWTRASRTAETMGAFWYVDGMSGIDLTGTGSPERLAATLVADGFFQTLGTRPLYGRTLIADDQVPGRNRVAVVSHGLWTRRFASDPSIVGRPVTLNGEPFEIVGVMPAAFTYPAGRRIDVWVPLSYFGPDQIGRARGARFLAVIARLKPGVSEVQFRSELSGISEKLSRDYPESAGWTSVTTAPIEETIVGEVRRPLMVLMAAVGMLLLIACVNIAGLLLARASSRQPELAVRAALGAGRARIARQLATESLTLAVLGGIIGVGVSLAAIRAFAAWGATELPRPAELRIDGAVLAFTLALSLVSGLAFGVFPALRGSTNLEQSLRAGGRGAASGAGQRLRSALVVVEVALAVVLVAGAALAAKSLIRLLAVDPGFRASSALVVTASVPSLQHYVATLEAIAAIPGVQAAGSIRDLPMQGLGEQIRPGVAGRPTVPGGDTLVQRHHVSVDYFKAMGIPLRAGRTFTASDRADAPRVFVINEEAARRIWPGEDAVGKAFRFGQTEIPVIGVVADVRQGGLSEPVEPAVYMHVMQQFRSRMTIVIRTSGDPLRYADAVRHAIWSKNPEQTITSVTTLEDVMERSVSRPRLLAWLLGAFGTMGLTLGALGIFGVLAFAVSQRRREIGVRVALGASPRTVLRLVVLQGMALAVGGVVLGVIGAVILTRSMESVLFGIEPTDPWTLVQVVAVLLGAAALASWLPARRALAIDPVSALRFD